jgi:hypothetical protein
MSHDCTVPNYARKGLSQFWTAWNSEKPENQRSSLKRKDWKQISQLDVNTNKRTKKHKTEFHLSVHRWTSLALLAQVLATFGSWAACGRNSSDSESLDWPRARAGDRGPGPPGGGTRSLSVEGLR